MPKIVLLLGLVLTVIVSMFFSIAKKPVMTEHSFPFTITYEFDGEIYTIEDEYVCNYTGAGQSVDPSDRFYDGVLKNADEDSEGDYLIQAYEDGELVIYTNFFAVYMMGDPLYKDHYNEYYRFEPHVAYYVYEDYIEYEDEEHLAPYDVKIVDWNYPEPVENDFVFSNFTRLTYNNVLPMLTVSLLTMVACIVLVKKEKDLKYGLMEKIEVILNFAILLVALPFLTVVSLFIDINGNGASLGCQIFYCIPAITVFGLSSSIVLRRKGYGKAGFVIQFAGITLTALLLILESILQLF